MKSLTLLLYKDAEGDLEVLSLCHSQYDMVFLMNSVASLRLRRAQTPLSDLHIQGKAHLQLGF